MIHKILCPVDFSKESDNAAEYANELSVLTEAKLILFHKQSLLSITHGSLSGDNLTYSVESMTRENMALLLQNLIKKNDRKNIKSILSFGLSTKEEIITAIREYNPDLIVMNTEGAEGLGELLTGTKTENIIEKNSWPVLVVPPDYKFMPNSEIILATDYEGYNGDSLQFILELSRFINSHITILHVLQTESEEKPEFDKMNNPLVSFQSIINKNIPEAIVNFSKEKQAGLIVVDHHEKSLIESLVDPGITKKIIKQSEIPILVF